MPSATLRRDVTKYQTQIVAVAVAVPERPILTVEDAFQNAGMKIMTSDEKKLLKIQTQLSSVSEHQRLYRFIARYASFFNSVKLSLALVMFVAFVIGLGPGLFSNLPPLTKALFIIGDAATFALLLALLELALPDRAVGHWYTGTYDSQTGEFELLDPRNQKTQKTAHHVHVKMTERLSMELAKIPGLQFHFVVQTYANDPIGGVEVLQGDKYRRFNYVAWMDYKVLWPQQLP